MNGAALGCIKGPKWTFKMREPKHQFRVGKARRRGKCTIDCYLFKAELALRNGLSLEFCFFFSMKKKTALGMQG